MAREWKTPQNFRASPSPVAAEPFEVFGGIGLLAEAPADPANPATPITVTVDGVARTRVSGVPAAGQYRILAQIVIGADGTARSEYLPVLQFHASDEGLAGTATYFRTGTVLTAEFFDLLRWFLTPLTGVADLSALNAAYPPTMDATKRGHPGDMARTTGGVVYMSDGSSWTTLGVELGNLAAFSAAAAVGFQSSSSFSAAWSDAMAFAAAFGFSASAAYISGGVTGALALAAQLGVAATSSFSASWTDDPGAAASSFGVAFSSGYTPPSGNLLPFTDPFDDSSVNITLWDQVQAGGGTITETTALRLTSLTAMTNAAALKLKQQLVRGTAYTIKIDVDIHTIAFSGNQGYLAMLIVPGQGAPDYGVRLWAGNASGTSGSLECMYARSTDGAAQVVASNAPAGATRRIRLDLTATTFRFRIMSVDEVTTYSDSGVLNLSSVYGSGAESMDFYLGDWNTGWANADITVRRCEITSP